MTGYTRNDTGNNIADGNIIDAADLDGEFDAIQTAFDATAGHTHDGTVGGGAPIDTLGPTQDIVVTATTIRPKTDNTVDLGTSALEFKNLYLDGTASIDSLVADTADINGGTIDGTVIGGTTAAAGTFTTATATTGNITTVNATTIDTTNIEVTTLKAKDGTAAGSIANTTGVVTLASSVLTTTDINGGTIDGTVIGGTTAAAVTGTTITGSGFVSTGNMSFGDNNKAIFGAGSDLQIYHTGNHSYVDEAGTGNLYLNSNGAGTIITGAGATQAQFFTGGAANLFHNNSQKLATTSTGVDVTGTVTASTSLNVTSGIPYIDLKDTSTTDYDGRILNYAGGFSVRTLNDASSAATLRLNIDHATGDISFYEDTGTTPKFFWDASAEALGIGTSSPAAPLHIVGNTYVQSGTIFTDVIASYGGTSLAINGGSTLTALTSGAERMRIDSSGNVGIGTSSPIGKLDSYSTTVGSNGWYMSGNFGAPQYPMVRLYAATPGKVSSLGNNGDGSLQFYVNGSISDIGTYAGQFDSSGNLLVGTTSKPTISSEGNGVYLEDTVNGDAAFSVKANGAWFRAKSDVGPGWGYSGFQGYDSAGRFQWGVTTNGTSAIQFFNSGSEKMRIDASGDLLVGTTTLPTTGSTGTRIGNYYIYLAEAGTGFSTRMAFINSNGTVGTIATNGSSTSYNTSSDYRLKEGWLPITGASDRVLALKPCNFAWKVDGSRADGFLAHELQEVVPEAVHGVKDAVDEDGKPVYQGIDQSKLVPLLTAALQEALTEIASLKARLDAANL